ncbi:MAG: acetyl-CoA carboxylase biotin carboxylase subunit [Polyangiaceae bacterium]|jgi:acetyl-CoA carboxylase biotin carboxylase subunit|nr:acetyl-CoA carboxylase biotin carboxylase subunit [Polyangiaceae bacterium]
MVSKILVANRGEIAVRIMRTAQEMGLRTVAVYSHVDERAMHVLAADEAVCLGEADPRQSYLHIDRVLQAARDTGADAIHPGYGFLSENPEFAKRVVQSGLIFIGPPASAMRQLGSKTLARQLASKVHVPFIPGMTTPSADPAELRAAAERLGYPVLLKASAGGGGKGMRLVESASEMAEAADRAASEASAAFGDGSIYVEKAIKCPRHVEIQILADRHGNVVHLFERECSIQRRHQKVIEESPSPVMTPELRQKMGEAAIAIAKAAGYQNAGTVEFLVDSTGRFYFLEVNTRLQVEHPVTEMITGLDLVRHQIEIARGEPLPFKQGNLHARGHAIECRIYAEDPENGFLPSPGTVLLARTPTGPGVRYDTGIYSGFEVPVHYDPILGKLITWAEDRPAALQRMLRALRSCVVLGVRTPIELMMDVIDSEPFRAGHTHTGFLQEHFADWKPDGRADELAQVAVLAHRAFPPAGRAVASLSAGAETPSPWLRLGGWDLA